MSHDSAPDAESNVCGGRDGVSATVDANKREEKEKKKKRMKKRRMTCPLRPAALWGELRGVKERERERDDIKLLCSTFPWRHSMHSFPNSRGRDPPKFSEINLRG